MSRNRGPIDQVGGEKDTYKTVSSLPLMQAVPASDVIYPETLLYIEGVQVPFTAISVSTSYTGMPQASIEIPYFPGLQEILKGYFPKVHVFFHDYRMEKYQNFKGGDELETAELRRLLFSGIIIGCQYSKRKGTSDASMSITFRCVHKYYPFSDILFKFGARGAEQAIEQDSGAVAGLVAMNSPQAMISVVGGVTKPDETNDKPVSLENANDCSINHLVPELRKYYDRLQGIPGIAMAIWNLFKRDTFIFKNNARIMTDIYIPLVDGGLRPFERLSGHKVVESTVSGQRKKIDETKLAERYKGVTLQPSDTLGTAGILIPPGFKNFLGEAAAVDISILVTQTGLQYMGELSNIWAFTTSMLRSLDYDMETLASPIQRTDGPAVDLVVKPLLPFFFSPVCNVLLPNLWDSVTINDDSVAVPTRVTTQGSTLKAVGANIRELEYRGPEDVREAIAYMSPSSNGTLGSTKFFIGEYPAIHEFGRGVRVKRIEANRWVSLLGADASVSGLSSLNERRIILTEDDPLVTTKLENLSDEKRVWKHWPGGTASPENPKSIPYYTLDPSKTKGYDMEYGKAGAPGAAAASKIKTLREDTAVPDYWNVVYYPDDDYFAVFPPHYDYVRNEWWMTKQMHDSRSWVGILNVRDKPEDKEKEEKASVNYDASTNKVAKDSTAPVGESKEVTLDTTEKSLLESLRIAWNNEYPDNVRLNPYESFSVNESTSYEITLFALVDYQAGLSLVETRTATVSGSFNPYAIPGYPMEVVDAATDSSSLHGFCVSVTHSITASSIETSYSMSSVMTYDEMRRYKLPSILPWFRQQFGMWDNLSLINQSESVLKTANQYYLDVLGVGVADPTILEDADTGAANSVLLDPTGRLILDGKNVFEEANKSMGQADVFQDVYNPNLSYEGNLSLVRREIETQADIEEFAGIRFIDIANRSSLSQVETVQDSPLRAEGTGKVAATTSLPGYSVFLNYQDQIKSLAALKANLSGTTPTKKQTQIKEKK